MEDDFSLGYLVEPAQSYWDRAGNFGSPTPPSANHMTAEAAQLSTSKVPPYWSPQLELRGYPFRVWLQDVGIWSSSTELREEQLGGAVIQRLGGVARQLARSLDPDTVRNGRLEFDNVGQPILDLNGEHVRATGLQLLLRALQRRYGQQDIETSVSCIVDLMTFRRLAHESIDDSLTRLEVIKSRAEELGDFHIGTGGLAWMMLHHLGISKVHWPLLLAPFQGRFPANEAGLQQLLTAIRTQCHLLERTHSTSRTLEEGWRRPAESGHFFNELDASGGTHETLWEGFAAMQPTAAESSAASWSGEPRRTDGYFDISENFIVDGYCTDTEDEQEMSDAEALEFYGDMSETTADQLYMDYLYAKRRFRKFVGRPPRHHRGGKGAKGKGVYPRTKGKDVNPFRSFGKGKGKTYASVPGGVLGAQALAGGKGKKSGKGNAGASFKNPIGQDGKRMTCHSCGSDEHLIAQCPKRHGQHMWVNPIPHQHQNQQQQQSTGVNFFVGGAPPQPASEPADAARSNAGWSMLDFTNDENITNDENTGEPRTSSTPTSTTAAWTNPLPEEARGSGSTQLMFSWWPLGSGIEIDATSSSGSHSQESYLVRMKTRKGEGLLIDPGSPGNLVGERWSQRHAQECARAGVAAPDYTSIEPFVVGGVGAKPQTCRKRVSHRIGLDDGLRGSYTAPEIPDSDVPALMGLETMDKHRALLDVHSKRLILVGPGGYKLQLSPGSRVYDLEQANTGHLMLPCSNFESVARSGQTVSFNAEPTEHSKQQVEAMENGADAPPSRM